jgi:hypothetical protein
MRITSLARIKMESMLIPLKLAKALRYKSGISPGLVHGRFFIVVNKTNEYFKSKAERACNAAGN